LVKYPDSKAYPPSSITLLAAAAASVHFSTPVILLEFKYRSAKIEYATHLFTFP